MAQTGRRAEFKSSTDLSAPIPDRLYYRIGEVAHYCGVATSVLRFWETQFPQLKPAKGGTGQRLYRRRELDLALRIHQLVHVQGYTLAGARQAIASQTIAQTPQPETIAASIPSVLPLPAPLAEASQHPRAAAPAPAISTHALAILRAELSELRELLIRGTLAPSSLHPATHADAATLRRRLRPASQASSQTPTLAPSLFADLDS